MRQKLEKGAKRISQNPVAHKVIHSMRPEKSLWGFLGIIIFFILPEVVAFFYATEITTYANAQLLLSNPTQMHYYYKMLVMLFEDGVSYFNLLMGVGLLVWFFF
jgi:hypothetical protein